MTTLKKTSKRKIVPGYDYQSKVASPTGAPLKRKKRRKAK